MAEKTAIPVIDEANPKKWAVDVSGWRMRQIKAWHKASQSADVDGMNELMLIAVTVTPDGNALNADVLDDLTFDEWRELVKAVNDTLNANIFRS